MRRILHVDMDAFYASVEQLDDARLRGRPVIVGADPKAGLGRGVVSACSYEARRYGIRSALPISQAWRRCPSGIYLRPRMDRYVEVSATVMDILRRYTQDFEQISIDEAFLDVTGSETLMGPAEGIARAIKRAVGNETGLTASVGLAPNKFLAKIASDLEKPDGFVIVGDTQVAAFLRALPISRLWGVGPKTAHRLERMGITTIGKLATIPCERLVENFGNWGEHLWNLAQGNDERPIVTERKPKSISNETTFLEDTDDLELIEQTLRRLSDKVAERLRRNGYRSRTLTLKLRFASFTTYTRQTSVPEGIDSGNDVFGCVGKLFERFTLGENVRLVGVGAHNLVPRSEAIRQGLLFEGLDSHERLSSVVDEIRDRYGITSLRRASELSD